MALYGLYNLPKELFKVVNEDISDLNSVLEIIIHYIDDKTRDRLKLHITDDDLIDQTLEELKKVVMRQKPSNRTPVLNYTLAIHTPNRTFLYDYSSDIVVTDSETFNILSGDFKSFIKELSMEWVVDQ